MRVLILNNDVSDKTSPSLLKSCFPGVQGGRSVHLNRVRSRIKEQCHRNEEEMVAYEIRNLNTQLKLIVILLGYMNTFTLILACYSNCSQTG